jgi:hypothetical protein
VTPPVADEEPTQERVGLTPDTFAVTWNPLSDALRCLTGSAPASSVRMNRSRRFFTFRMAVSRG